MDEKKYFNPGDENQEALDKVKIESVDKNDLIERPININVEEKIENEVILSPNSGIFNDLIEIPNVVEVKPQPVVNANVGMSNIPNIVNEQSKIIQPMSQPVVAKEEPVKPQPVVTANVGMSNVSNTVNEQPRIIQPIPQPVVAKEEPVKPQPVVNANVGMSNVSNTVNEQPRIIQPIPQPAVPNQNDVINSVPLVPVEPAKKKKNKKKMIFILIGIIIIVLGAIGGFVYFGLKTNSKNAFLLSLNSIKSDLVTMMEPATYTVTTLGDKYEGEGNFKINLASDMFTDEASEDYAAFLPMIENINKIDFKYSFGQDLENKKALLNFTPSLNNENLINFKYYAVNNKQYMLFEDILNKYIEIEDSELNLSDSYDYNKTEEEMNYLYEVVLTSLNKNLKSEYFTKEDVTIQIDGEDKDVVKSTLVLDEKNVSELTANILEDLKADKRTNEFISKYYPEFKDYVLEVEENTVNGGKLYFSTYMNKLTGKQYKYEIKTVDEEEISLLTYTLNKQREIIISNISKSYPEDNMTYKILISMGDNETIIEVTDKDSKQIMKMSLSEEKMTMTFKAESEGTTIEGSYASELETVKEGSDYKLTTNGTLKITQGEINIITLSMVGDFSAKNGATINEDITNAIKSEDMTYEESDKIMTGIMNALATLMQ